MLNWIRCLLLTQNVSISDLEDQVHNPSFEQFEAFWYPYFIRDPELARLVREERYAWKRTEKSLSNALNGEPAAREMWVDRRLLT